MSTMTPALSTTALRALALVQRAAGAGVGAALNKRNYEKYTF